MTDSTILPPADSWNCPCGALMGASLVFCPGCGKGRPAAPIPFPCHACGAPAESDVPPDSILYFCNDCEQRVAYGKVVGRWVVEPAGPGMIRLRVTVGAALHELLLDNAHAAAVATNILSITIPGA